MARGINKVILLGYLGADPDIKASTTGGTVGNFRLATSDTWKDKNTGQNQEKTEWHTIVVFNKLAEICRDYLKKGSRVYLEGSLRTRKWQDKNNQDRYTTEIVCSEMQMLDSKGIHNSEIDKNEKSNVEQDLPDNNFDSRSQEKSDDIPF